MPTYDYQCTACGHEFELVQAMSAPIRRKCPSCETLKLKRLIGVGAGFIVKGRTSAPPSESKAATSNADTKDTSDTKTEAAPKADTMASSDSSTKDVPIEKKMSGSTSTPTHAAREHRGVGNLVDKAKRLAADKSKATPPKKTSKQQRASRKAPAPKRPKQTPSGKPASRSGQSKR
jgi:putative FmdB family regulatory protein